MYVYTVAQKTRMLTLFCCTAALRHIKLIVSCSQSGRTHVSLPPYSMVILCASPSTHTDHCAPYRAVEWRGFGHGQIMADVISQRCGGTPNPKVSDRDRSLAMTVTRSVRAIKFLLNTKINIVPATINAPYKNHL